MHVIRCRRGDSGFTLVEVLAALFVFSIVTLGVIPLLSSSLRGSNLARSYTVGKNVATQAMEKQRGLPYYVSRPAQAGDVDVLDLYHPAPPNSGNEYVVNCPTGLGSSAVACPRSLPTGYSIQFRSRFVEADGTTTEPTPANYRANPGAGQTDEPPSLLMRSIIRVNWTVLGRNRSFDLDTLLGDHKAVSLSVLGRANLDYGIQVGATFNSSVTGQTRATAIGAVSESALESRRESTADQSVTAALLRLTDPTDPNLPPLDEERGAESAVHAPPNVDPGPINDGDNSLGHPTDATLASVAFADDTIAGPASPAEADIKAIASATQPPSAQGGLTFLSGDAVDFWLDRPEAARGSGSRWELALNSPLLSLVTADGLDTNTTIETLSGYTRALTTNLPAGGVNTTAHVEFEEMRLFPTTFAPEGVVRIDEFTADVACNASAASGTKAATATYSAVVRYWQESGTDATGAPRNNNGVADGDYSAPQTITGTGTDLLAQIASANPLVYEQPEVLAPEQRPALQPGDIYLFQTQDRIGYLSTWSTLRNPAGALRNNGRIASARLDGAVSINTAPVPVPAGSVFTQLPINISLGAMSCEAVDLR